MRMDKTFYGFANTTHVRDFALKRMRKGKCNQSVEFRDAHDFRDPPFQYHKNSRTPWIIMISFYSLLCYSSTNYKQ